MKHVKCKIYHKGCFGSETSERFPELKLTIINPHFLVMGKKKESLKCGLWEVSGKENELEKYISYIKRRKDVVWVKKHFKDENKIFFSFIWKKPKKFMLAQEVVLEKNLINLEQPTIKDGYEMFDLLLFNSKDCIRLLKEFDEIGELKILKSVDARNEKNDLQITEKQKQALQLAISHKYYSWPRKIKLEALAKKLYISRSSFQEHLRKAEAKLFPKLVKEKIKVIE